MYYYFITFSYSIVIQLWIHLVCTFSYSIIFSPWIDAEKYNTSCIPPLCSLAPPSPLPSHQPHPLPSSSSSSSVRRPVFLWRLVESYATTAPWQIKVQCSRKDSQLKTCVVWYSGHPGQSKCKAGSRIAHSCPCWGPIDQHAVGGVLQPIVGLQEI